MGTQVSALRLHTGASARGTTSPSPTPPYPHFGVPPPTLSRSSSRATTVLCVPLPVPVPPPFLRLSLRQLPRRACAGAGPSSPLSQPVLHGHVTRSQQCQLGQEEGRCVVEEHSDGSSRRFG
jgi:hypothetical protein